MTPPSPAELALAYDAYVGHARSHGVTQIPTIEVMTESPHGRASLLCLVMAVRARTKARIAKEIRTAVAVKPARRIIDNKMRAAGERDDDYNPDKS